MAARYGITPDQAAELHGRELLDFERDVAAWERYVAAAIDKAVAAEMTRFTTIDGKRYFVGDVDNAKIIALLTVIAQRLGHL